jgi:hypothetical protein
VRHAVATGLLLVAGLSFLPAAVSHAQLRDDDDERTSVLVRRECSSRLEREEVTLFANGTVRVWEGPLGEEKMALGELVPDELETYVRRLREEDLSETERHSQGPEGEWVEGCRLELRYGAMARWLGAPPAGEDRDWRPSGDEVFLYRRFDSLSLPLSRVVSLVDAVAARVDRAAGRHSLPPDYRPQEGDVLRRSDDVLFRIERRTADKHGWEMQGVEQPLAVYVPEDEIPKLFVELVERH